MEEAVRGGDGQWPGQRQVGTKPTGGGFALRGAGMAVTVRPRPSLGTSQAPCPGSPVKGKARLALHPLFKLDRQPGRDQVEGAS